MACGAGRQVRGQRGLAVRRCREAVPWVPMVAERQDEEKPLRAKDVCVFVRVRLFSPLFKNFNQDMKSKHMKSKQGNLRNPLATRRILLPQPFSMYECGYMYFQLFLP